MRQTDAEMLKAFADMSDARPVGEALRPITSKTQDEGLNRKERRARASNARRKKPKFARK